MPVHIANRTFSPRQLAQALGVSESSMKRWIDAGDLRAARTAGGHRRVTQREAVRFIRERRLPVLDPAALGLPELALADGVALTAGVLVDALTAPEATQAGPLLVAAFLRGVSLPGIFDGPLREAMHHLGTLWNHGDEGILFEHRATDVVIQAVSQIRSLLPAARPSAPVAVGAAFATDPYLLPSLLVATVLADAGFRVTNLGPQTPAAVLAETARRAGADLVWLSVSVPSAALVDHVESVHSSMPGVPFVIGGRGVEASAVPAADPLHALPDLGALSDFVRARWPGGRRLH